MYRRLTGRGAWTGGAYAAETQVQVQRLCPVASVSAGRTRVSQGMHAWPQLELSPGNVEVAWSVAIAALHDVSLIRRHGAGRWLQRLEGVGSRVRKDCNKSWCIRRGRGEVVDGCHNIICMLCARYCERENAHCFLHLPGKGSYGEVVAAGCLPTTPCLYHSKHVPDSALNGGTYSGQRRDGEGCTNVCVVATMAVSYSRRDHF